MILLLKYNGDKLYSINHVKYDDLGKPIQHDIQLYGYSDECDKNMSVKKLYADTDHMIIIERIFEKESNDIKQWMKLKNRYNTIKQILKHD